ncbi:MAG: phosphate ABC transporter permease PstA [Oscillibacter sp.]|nr:phosphate ABC transporter permease PstA [Oscillibacter sp.]MEA4994583.1 phosphate ABC transporter permease PstA [Oscillibacter sp.]
MKYTLINLFYKVGSPLRQIARRTAAFFGRLSRRIENAVLRIFPWLAAIFTFGALLFLIGHILVKGIPYLRPSLFALEYNTENVSLLPALVTTVFMVLLSLLIAAPLGLFTAIYLVEYAKRGSRLVRLVRVTAETLSGIPSIVYGLFGSLFFVSWLGWGYSLLAGTFTLSIMILPLIMRTAEESLKAVPDTYREGSFGLGAGRLRTVFRIVLPAAAPGILAGVILAMGRIVGETAALIYTAGSVAQIPNSLLASGRTLAIHMYALSSEGLYTGQAYATAVVLLVLVVGINALSAALAKRIAKG